MNKPANLTVDQARALGIGQVEIVHAHSVSRATVRDLATGQEHHMRIHGVLSVVLSAYAHKHGKSCADLSGLVLELVCVKIIRGSVWRWRLCETQAA